ncbi:MAG TPA: molecular chaperone DnaJ, partial [Hyphomicrobiaceae bacterium]|nr:molecular chaperone DnaJ [Hyphomicrobiaceae bacterium]
MKLDSKYFDSLRSTAEPRSSRREAAHACQWAGCNEPASHRAPMGRGREGRFYRFCLEHARQFNANYNYFQGMSDTEVEGYLKDSVTGHRPTWRMGNDPALGRGARSGASPRSRDGRLDGDDAHEVFEDAYRGRPG